MRTPYRKVGILNNMLDIINNPVFIITVMSIANFALFLYSLCFILVPDSINVSKSYTIIAKFFASEQYGFLTLSISVMNAIFFKTHFMRLFIPLTLIFFISVSITAYNSVGFITPISAIFIAISIFLSIAFFGAGGFMMKSIDELNEIAREDSEILDIARKKKNENTGG